MFTKSLRWPVLIVASIIAIFAMVAATPVSAAGMSVQPSSGSAGTTFVITADGFKSNEPVSVSIVLPTGSSVGSQTVSANSQGRAQFSMQLPSGSPAGKYTATARGLSSGRQYSATFTVTAPASSGGTTAVTPASAGMSVQPTVGDYTTGFALTAGGFNAGETVSVWVTTPNNSTLGPGNVMADASGAIRLATGVPTSFPTGQYTAYARGLSSGHQYSATFTLKTSTNPNWTGQYFNNRSLSGSPVFTRTDTAINFNWGTGGPGGGIPGTNFSVRWTSSPYVSSAGDYTINVTADDGVRVWVDGNLVIDEWADQSPTTFSATDYLGVGTHTVQVEYYQHLGGAMIQVQFVAD